MMKNPVRETTAFVVENAKDVKINKEKIKELVEEWAKENIKLPEWPEDLHFYAKSQKQVLDYLVILDSLNFCYWNKGKRWQIDHNGKKYNGYYAWSLVLGDFFRNNPEKANLEYFSKMSFKDFKNILQDGKNLLLLKERFKIAKAISKAIIEKYSSSENLVASADKKFSVLVDKIYKGLPYFNDTAFYKGKKIYFLKRAQILSSEIWAAFKGKGIGKFLDLDYLTCFADYKIPQILNYFGILEYSNILDKKIKNRVLIKKGSNQEIEIRACTIWAIEYLKEELKKLGKDIPLFLIDHILWNRAHNEKIAKPYYLTKTIFY